MLYRADRSDRAANLYGCTKEEIWLTNTESSFNEQLLLWVTPLTRHVHSSILHAGAPVMSFF